MDREDVSIARAPHDGIRRGPTRCRRHDSLHTPLTFITTSAEEASARTHNTPQTTCPCFACGVFWWRVSRTIARRSRDQEIADFPDPSQLIVDQGGMPWRPQLFDYYRKAPWVRGTSRVAGLGMPRHGTHVGCYDRRDHAVCARACAPADALRVLSSAPTGTTSRVTPEPPLACGMPQGTRAGRMAQRMWACSQASWLPRAW